MKNIIIDIICKLRSILNKRQKINIILILGLILVSSALELLSISSLIPLLEIIMDKEAFAKKEKIHYLIKVLDIKNQDVLVLGCIVLIIVAFLVKNIMLVVSDYVQLKFRCNLHKGISMKLLNSYMSYPYTYFIEINSSEILRGINSDASSVKGLINNIFVMVTNIITIVVLALYLLSLDVFLAIGLVVVMLICLYGVALKTKNNTREMGKRLRDADQGLLKYLTESIGGIKEFTVMNKRNFLITQYEREFEKKMNAEVACNLVISYTPRLMESVGIIGLVIIIALKMCVMGSYGQDIVANLAVFALAAIKIMPLISGVSQAFTSINYFYPALQSVYKTINDSNKVREECTEEQEEKISFTQILQLENVSWKYANSNKNVLSNVNLKIRKNESIALIGKSGEGKTTTADIILGLLSPQSGRVLVDGRDVYKNKESWSRVIAYVPQTVYLYDDTIKKNIAFGEKNIDEDRVWEVIKQAQLEEFISGLSEGIETRMGERGIKVSGGQRQRIAIARALYRDPQILVLDEATSALDNETEAAVMDAIEKLHGNITLIIIAHRLTTIQACDRIYEVKNGNIIEKKTSLL